jgi:hypothetical protein
MKASAFFAELKRRNVYKVWLERFPTQGTLIFGIIGSA